MWHWRSEKSYGILSCITFGFESCWWKEVTTSLLTHGSGRNLAIWLRVCASCLSSNSGFRQPDSGVSIFPLLDCFMYVASWTKSPFLYTDFTVPEACIHLSVWPWQITRTNSYASTLHPPYTYSSLQFLCHYCVAHSLYFCIVKIFYYF